jgi:hypothetical protein
MFPKAFFLLPTAFLAGVLGFTHCRSSEEEKPVLPNFGIQYVRDVEPLVAAHCFTCHSDTATHVKKAGYAFFNRFDQLKKYALDPSPDHPAMTKIQARIRYIDLPGMPLDQAPLREEDIVIIEKWIQEGAPHN